MTVFACVCVLFVSFVSCVFVFFFFNDTATTEIYTLSLHDALPISALASVFGVWCLGFGISLELGVWSLVFRSAGDRKSTRLNSSHSQISYAVFCLKKKKNSKRQDRPPRHRSAAHLR